VETRAGCTSFPKGRHVSRGPQRPDLSTTTLGQLTARLEVGFGLRDDREDLDFRLCSVIEHPDVANALSVLRLAETAEALDLLERPKSGSCILRSPDGRTVAMTRVGVHRRVMPPLLWAAPTLERRELLDDT